MKYSCKKIYIFVQSLWLKTKVGITCFNFFMFLDIVAKANHTTSDSILIYKPAQGATLIHCGGEDYGDMITQCRGPTNIFSHIFHSIKIPLGFTCEVSGSNPEYALLAFVSLNISRKLIFIKFMESWVLFLACFFHRKN